MIKQISWLRCRWRWRASIFRTVLNTCLRCRWKWRGKWKSRTLLNIYLRCNWGWNLYFKSWRLTTRQWRMSTHFRFWLRLTWGWKISWQQIKIDKVRKITKLRRKENNWKICLLSAYKDEILRLTSFIIYFQYQMSARSQLHCIASIGLFMQHACLLHVTFSFLIIFIVKSCSIWIK